MKSYYFFRSLLFFSFLFWGNAMSIGQTVAPDEIIIKFVDHAPYSFTAENIGCTFVRSINCIDAEVWRVSDTLTVGNKNIIGINNIVTYLDSFTGIVEYVHPNYDLELSNVPDDPNYFQLWGMNKINVPQAWNTQTGDPTVIVGVIDTGVDWGHSDLKDNIWQNLGEDTDGDGTVLEWNGNQWVFDPGDIDGIDNDGNGYIDDFVGWDFFNNDNNPYDDDGDACFGHGTHVSGTLGAVGNNGIGVTGVSWNVQIMGLRIFGYTSGGCYSRTDISIDALEYAIQMGAPISNNSWGGGNYNPALYDAIQMGQQSNHLFVAAAGNKALDTDIIPFYPASYDLDNIISVAATDTSDVLSVYNNSYCPGSNYGASTVDLMAPGSDIYSTVPNEGYGFLGGTSMAAPHIAGTVALLLSECPTLTYQQIKNLLIASVDPVGNLEGKCVADGRLNVETAMQYLQTFCNPVTNCLTSDSLALVALYNATDGANWTNPWNLFEPVNTWYGVTLNLTLNGTLLNMGPCRVMELNLSNNQLSGTIPPELGNLTGLITLELGSSGELLLADNQLRGTIPPELGNLINLTTLALGGNQLSGTIPPELGNLVNLITLSLAANQLTGSIPTESGNLMNLTTLYLSANQLSGYVPIELGNLINLSSLSLASNQLRGYIPPELGNLTNLTYLRFNDNQFSGCYPSEWCDFNFSYFDCTDNLGLPDNGSEAGFQGFCNGESCKNSCLLFDSLTLINIYNATNGPNWTIEWDTTQPVSTWHGVTLTNDGCGVSELNLSNNQLSGSFPGAFCNLLDLTYLDISNNQLNDSLPNKIGILSNLTYLDISANQLSGSIPTSLGNLVNLTYLSLGANQLNGSIPPKLGNLTNLTYLYFGYNQLDGPIPPELGNLGNLTYLYLGHNNLSGDIPIELGNLNNLTDLSLGGIQSNNQLSGCYPPQWCNIIFTTFDCTDNPDLPNNGSFAGFQDFCAGNTTCQICDVSSLGLGAPISINCGESVVLSTNLSAVAYTLWDYEEAIIVGDSTNITVSNPGIYTVAVGDLCGNIVTGTVEVVENTDCVWPGDINYDYVVNNLDVLQWAITNGRSGPIRPGATTDWIGQNAPNWSSSVNGINDKHSTTNGDAVVDTSDLAAIKQNYGKIHGTVINSITSTVNANIVSNINTSSSSVEDGTVIFDFVLENAFADVQGIAWTIELANDVEIGNLTFEYDSDWFGTEGSEVVSFYYHENNTNTIDIALARIDGQSISGSGSIGKLTISSINTIIAELDAVLPWGGDSLARFNICVIDPVLLDNNENLFGLNTNCNDLSIATSCPSVITHTTNNTLNGWYKANDEIMSTGVIYGPNTVNYVANTIALGNNFSVELGAELDISIGGCNALNKVFPEIEIVQSNNDKLNLAIQLFEPTQTRLAIYNHHGLLVKEIIKDEKLFNTHYDYTIDISDLPINLYYLIMKTDEQTITKKLPILK